MSDVKEHPIILSFIRDMARNEATTVDKAREKLNDILSKENLDNKRLSNIVRECIKRKQSLIRNKTRTKNFDSYNAQADVVKEMFQTLIAIFTKAYPAFTESNKYFANTFRRLNQHIQGLNHIDHHYQPAEVLEDALNFTHDDKLDENIETYVAEQNGVKPETLKDSLQEEADKIRDESTNDTYRCPTGTLAKIEKDAGSKYSQHVRNKLLLKAVMLFNETRDMDPDGFLSLADVLTVVYKSYEKRNDIYKDSVRIAIKAMYPDKVPTAKIQELNPQWITYPKLMV